MNELISIIIPTYNRSHLIRETLDSILAQTHKNWECIVVDDGSTDETEDVLNEYVKKDNRFQYHKRSKGRLKGPNSCRNYGFELSKGSLIQFFDSDDVMKSNCLSKKISLFSELIDVVICKLTLYDFEEKRELRQNIITSENLLYDYFCGRVALYICGPIWKRSFLSSKSILFDNNVVNCDDWDFNMRMFYFEPKCKFIDESLILYRIHSQSLSNGILNNNFVEILSVSNLLDKHLFLLRRKENSSLRKYYKYAIQFNKYYLLQSILSKNKIQFFLFKRIFKYCIKYGFLYELSKIIIGRILFMILGKGSVFFK